MQDLLAALIAAIALVDFKTNSGGKMKINLKS